MWHLVQFKYVVDFASFWLTEFFHSWPHIAYEGFESYSSTFNPDDVKYIQTLIFWGAIPVLWLLLSLLFVTIYGICQCCKNRKRQVHPNHEKPRRTKCLKWMIITLALFCGGFIGAGFYGNETAASGVQHAINSAQDVNHTVESAEEEIGMIDHSLKVDLAGEVDKLDQVFSKPIANKTVQGKLLVQTELLKKMVNDIAENVSAISDAYNNDIDLSILISQVQYYETFRWLGLIAIFCFELVIFLMVLCGACTRNRCSLVCSAILCTVGIVLIWCLAGAEMFVTMGLSDFCDDPNAFIIKETKKNTQLSNDFINYYITCDQSMNPFSKSLSSANKYLALADATLDSVASLSKGYYDNAAADITEAKNTVASITSDFQMLTASLECSSGIHKDYTTMLYSVCYDIAIGFTLMLLSGVLVGVIITVILVCSISLGSKIRKRKIAYTVDQEDPFLPPDNQNATLERYRRNVVPNRDVNAMNEYGAAPIPVDHRARPVSLSSSLQGYSHNPGPSSAHQSRPANQRGGNSSRGVPAVAAPQPSSSQMVASPGSYDSPPPSYTLAMSRDNQRRHPDNRQQRAQAQQSSGSIV